MKNNLQISPLDEFLLHKWEDEQARRFIIQNANRQAQRNQAAHATSPKPDLWALPFALGGHLFHDKGQMTRWGLGFPNATAKGNPIAPFATEEAADEYAKQQQMTHWQPWFMLPMIEKKPMPKIDMSKLILSWNYPQDNTRVAMPYNEFLITADVDKQLKSLNENTISTAIPKLISIEDFLDMCEGYRNNVYKDSKGYLTVGRGHKLTTDEQNLYPVGSTVPKQILENWWEKDLKGAEKYVKDVYSDEEIETMNRLNPNFYTALLSMAFQNPSFVTQSGSPKFTAAVKEYLKNPSQENIEKVISETQRIDDGDPRQWGLAKRYGLTRYLLNPIFPDITSDNIKEEYNKDRFAMHGSNKPNPKKTKQ